MMRLGLFQKIRGSLTQLYYHYNINKTKKKKHINISINVEKGFDIQWEEFVILKNAWQTRSRKKLLLHERWTYYIEWTLHTHFSNYIVNIKSAMWKSFSLKSRIRQACPLLLLLPVQYCIGGTWGQGERKRY